MTKRDTPIILVVEDYPDTRHLLSALLRSKGYMVVEAGDETFVNRLLDCRSGSFVDARGYVRGSQLHALIVQGLPHLREDTNLIEPPIETAVEGMKHY